MPSIALGGRRMGPQMAEAGPAEEACGEEAYE
jgi:hypothetical protein